MFSTGLYSEATDAPAFVVLNVFPRQGQTIMILSYLAENQTQVSVAFSDLLGGVGEYRLYELSRLVLRKCENFVLAPSMFDSFPEAQREAIRNYFERNTWGGHSYDIDDPRLFLFGPVRR